MSRQLKKLVRFFVPRHIQDPGLLIRMIRSGSRAAWFTILTTVLGFLLAPLDMLFEIFEKKYYERASGPRLPLIFVCGAPRTGTTLASQVLINNLPVSYFNNLTALFPRSPIVANRLFGRLIGRKMDYESYYSKTVGLSGPNDAFYIWNRWMVEDETGMQCVLLGSKTEAMVRFFGAYEQAFQKPIISKNNSLNTRAVSIANVFKQAYFICMTRDPAYVAQSLLAARLEIQGDLEARLWVDNPDKSHLQRGDYIEDVCDQVLYHERKILEQQQIIGADRFWIVSYEQFCREPELLIKRVSEQILGQRVDLDELKKTVKPFQLSNAVRMPPPLFKQIKQTLADLRGDPVSKQLQIEDITL